MLNKVERFYAILFGAVAVLLWAFFTLIDFEFSESVFNNASWIDWAVRFSMVPAFVIGWIFGIRLLAYAFRGNLIHDTNTTPVLHMILGLVVALAFPIYLFWSILRLSNLADDSNSWIIMLVLVVLSVAAGIRFTSSRMANIVYRSSRAVTGLSVLLINLLLSVIFAFLWQRDTYETILNGEAAIGFTPWYQPNFARIAELLSEGNFTFGSYPSFIATNAFSLNIAIFLPEGNKRSLRNFIFVLSMLYGLFISILLVISGKAYVTDCFASLAISLVSLAIGSVVFKWYVKKHNLE